MAVIVGEAAVRLRPEASRFGDEAEKEIDGKLPGVAKKAAGFFAAAFAAAGVGAFLGHAIGEAVDFGENMSKVGVVFGDSAAAVQDFASTASTALGQSENQALAAAGTFGSLFVGMGIGQQQAADMSTSMLTLASDMASFGNATPDEALEALRAGLIGEAEPLRRFGIMLDSAKIEAEALRLGLMDAGGELTEAAKAQAVYSLAMQQASLQHGDFQRTSEGLANQQRILKAQFTDVSTDIGGLFVPMLANAAQGITGTLMPAILGATSGLPAIGDALGSMGDMWRVGFADGPQAVNEATAGLDGLPFIIGQVAGTAGDLGAVFRESLADGAAGSALLAEGSLQGLAANLGVMFAGIRETVAPAFLAIQEAVGPALAQVGDAFSAAFGGGGGGGIMASLGPMLQTVGPLIGEYIARWAAVFAEVIPIVADVLSALAPIISGLVAQIGPVLSALLPVVSQVAGVIATTLVTVLSALAPVIPPLVAAIGQVAAVLAGAFLTVLQAVAPVLPVIVQAIAQLAGALAQALGQALAAIVPLLPPLIDALLALLMGALTPLLPLIPVIAGVFGQLVAALVPILPIVVQLATMLIQLAIAAIMPVVNALMPLLPIIAGLAAQLITLVLQAITPLLPLLPILAQMFMAIMSAILPILPVIIQLVTSIIQVAVSAILPLLPIIVQLIGMLLSLIPVFMPLIQMWLQLQATILTFVGSAIGAIFGFVGQVIGAIGNVISFFVGLPGRILGAVAGFGGLLFGKGVELIQGLVNGIASAASFVGNIARNVVNSIIRFINSNVIDGINNLLQFSVMGVTINPPDIPRIPTLHSGGVFTTSDGTGEGLALLRNDELVATPEQRLVADNLLRSLLAGDLPAAAPTAPAAGTVINIEENVYAQPGEPAGAVAARATQAIVWNLNGGLTRRLGDEVLA